MAACAAAIVHRNHFFRLYQQNKSSAFTGSSDTLVIIAKRFLKLPNLFNNNKIKDSINSKKLDSRHFGRIANSVLSQKEGKSALPPLYLYSPEGLSSASDKAKLQKNFSKNSTLDDSLPAFSFRTNLKLHNIHVTPKLVKKVITNLDLLKTSGPKCIPVVVLKKYEPDLSYILAALFNLCLKGSRFPDCWKFLSVVPVFKNVTQRSRAKNYHLVSILSLVSKVFEKLVSLPEMRPFVWFPVWF